MTGSSTQGIKTVLHPVSDLAAAKAVYTALLGIEPQHDADYYVGFEAKGQHIGLTADYLALDGTSQIVPGTVPVPFDTAITQGDLMTMVAGTGAAQAALMVSPQGLVSFALGLADGSEPRSAFTVRLSSALASARVHVLTVRFAGWRVAQAKWDADRTLAEN